MGGPSTFDAKSSLAVSGTALVTGPAGPVRIELGRARWRPEPSSPPTTLTEDGELTVAAGATVVTTGIFTEGATGVVAVGWTTTARASTKASSPFRPSRSRGPSTSTPPEAHRRERRQVSGHRASSTRATNLPFPPGPGRAHRRRPRLPPRHTQRPASPWSSSAPPPRPDWPPDSHRQLCRAPRARTAVTGSFKVTNAGTQAAAGGWNDSVYLAPNRCTSQATRLVARVVHATALAGGQSIRSLHGVEVPPVAAGSYELIGRPRQRRPDQHLVRGHPGRVGAAHRGANPDPSPREQLTSDTGLRGGPVLPGAGPASDVAVTARWPGPATADVYASAGTCRRPPTTRW